MSGTRLGAYVARRVVVLLALLALLSLIVFGLLYLAPGDTVQVLLGTRPASPETIAALRKQFHLDRPFLEQYWIWLSHAAQLDFGTSVRSGRTVASMIGGRAAVSGFLAVYALVLALGVGVPLGVLAAVRKRTAVDRGVVGLSVLGVSAPAFVTAVVLLYVFAVILGWFPVYGAGSGFVDRFWHLTLPALALSLTGLALIVKLTRAAMLTTLEQDYVGFALARGVPARRVLTRYALRNALVPIVTAAGLVLTVLLTGAVLVETTFSLPGVGSLLVEAVANKDVPVVQALAILLAAIVVLVNLVVDVLYTVIDPRIGFGRQAA